MKLWEDYDMRIEKSENYRKVIEDLTKGWHTYNNASMTSHVLMPYGFAVNIGFADHSETGAANLLVGEESQLQSGYVIPKAHSYDETYTEVVAKWRDITANIYSSSDGDDLVVLVDVVEQNEMKENHLTVEVASLWNSDVGLRKNGNRLTGYVGDERDEKGGGPAEVNVSVTAEHDGHFMQNGKTPYLSVLLSKETGVYTGRERTLDEVRDIIATGRRRWEENKKKYGECEELYNGMQTCLAWDTVYDPWDDAVYSTVSRQWNNNWGGSVLFCWDTYFAALMASLDNKELGYANAIAITKKHTDKGLVPNWALSVGTASDDRSQPPVGSMVCWEIYEHYREKWFLEEVWQDLFNWNTWFWEHRRTKDGLFAWGSDRLEGKCHKRWDDDSTFCRFGAALESGLDNSPMYDDIPFNEETAMIELEDAGLTGLFINDCRYLIKFAGELGRDEEKEILAERLRLTDDALELLWSEKDGIYLNRRTDTGEFSHRISPTNFYPLYSENVSEDRVRRIIEEHYFNPEEFYGDYVIPSIARNDPAYPDQNYWRGRIWAPMNYLVYMALLKHAGAAEDAIDDLADKSGELLLKEWLECGHIHENYSGDDGSGCGVENSDKYYHWGALLSYIKLHHEDLTK